jgi:hypothetical protein
MPVSSPDPRLPMIETSSLMTCRASIFRRGGAASGALALSGALVLMFAGTAGAAVTVVPLLTDAQYSVLGGQSVTNTGPSVLHLSLGVSSGTSITGFGGLGNGSVVAPGVIHNNDGPAAQAQLDNTAAYTNAMNRGVTATKAADLTGLTLPGGVYDTSSHGALLLTGTVTLDGGNDPNTVFIFQTDSSLTAEVGSHVALINGAQECNIFWQVGSTATLHTGADFSGNILASTSINLDSSVTVHGRALAQTGSVTLIDDTFEAPTCATSLPAPATTTTTPAPGGPGGVTTTTAAGSVTPVPGAVTTSTLGLTVGVVGPPRTGVAPLATHNFPWPALLLVSVGGIATAGVVLRRRVHLRMPARSPR